MDIILCKVRKLQFEVISYNVLEFDVGKVRKNI